MLVHRVDQPGGGGTAVEQRHVARESLSNAWPASRARAPSPSERLRAMSTPALAGQGKQPLATPNRVSLSGSRGSKCAGGPARRHSRPPQPRCGVQFDSTPALSRTYGLEWDAPAAPSVNEKCLALLQDLIALAIFGSPTWARTRALRLDGQSPPKIARPGGAPD